MSVLSRAGWSIGHDISVIGFDNVYFSGLSIPPLTSIKQPVEEIVRSSVDRLCELIDSEAAGRSSRPKRQLIRPELIARDSTNRP
jgi:DNA-binding LacI/PurR family transcriptional regulator